MRDVLIPVGIGLAALGLVVWIVTRDGTLAQVLRPPVPGPGPGAGLDSSRAGYQADLLKRGLADYQVAGDTQEAVYASYLVGFRLAIANGYTEDLRKRGYTGPVLTGGSVDAIKAAYEAALAIIKLGASAGVPAAPVPTTGSSGLPRYSIRQRVITPRGGSPVETIVNWRFDAATRTWSYLMEDQPFTWWQENLLRAA